MPVGGQGSGGQSTSEWLQKMEVNLLECPDGLVSWFLSQVEIQNHVGPLCPQETPEVLCVLNLPLVCGLKAEESGLP